MPVSYPVIFKHGQAFSDKRENREREDTYFNIKGMLKAIREKNGKVFILDQSRLPHEISDIECAHWKDVARSIREMRIRGAPAIGIAAAMGFALGAEGVEAKDFNRLVKGLKPVAEGLRATRPTAVNLEWALERMQKKLFEHKGLPPSGIKKALWMEAKRIHKEDVAINRAIGLWGARFIKDGDVVLTHCNAGALATGGHGTATSAIYAARRQGKKIHVVMDETRPLLQGARLTALEMKAASIPATLITDNSAGALLRKGAIDLVIVGTDRTARNGDVANKIGTYPLAVLCKENKVPFYVAAPLSSIDFSTPTGDMIPIEERSPEEVLGFGGVRVAPKGIKALNMAFDVTPAKYVTAIITELGAFRPGDIRRLKSKKTNLEAIRL